MIKIMNKLRFYTGRAYKTFNKPEMRILPGNIAYFFVLALVPIITLIVLIASYFSISLDTVINFIEGIVPKEASEIIIDVIAGKGFDGSVGTFNIIAIFVASNGTYALINAANTLYNVETHDIIKKNIDRSPLYSGVIHGTGPRYCPSIEDKVMKFADKDRHQIFIEPEGNYTNEMYIAGMSSSLPEDVQVAMYRSVKGMENAQIVRNAYAIEYDCINPMQLKASLEFKKISGLFSGGQFNGSSGYEEAAAQGLIAGINAARKLQGKEPLVLDRSEAYIGVLIDDLVTKETHEPYRMMTSRTEYRLLHRQDNADRRLARYGHKLGLVSDAQMAAVEEKYAAVESERRRLEHTGVAPTPELTAFLAARGEPDAPSGARLADLLRRPSITYEELASFDPQRPVLSAAVTQAVEIDTKYQGYIDRQLRQVAEMKKLEDKLLPSDLDYSAITGLRLEARQKLDRAKPLNLGQASRISGVSPADISVLMVWLSQQKE